MKLAWLVLEPSYDHTRSQSFVVVNCWVCFDPEPLRSSGPLGVESTPALVILAGRGDAWRLSLSQFVNVAGRGDLDTATAMKRISRLVSDRPIIAAVRFLGLDLPLMSCSTCVPCLTR